MSAQKYTNPEAVQRMREGRCPECGATADEHSGRREFWLRPVGCDLLPRGVVDRIAQQAETDAADNQT